VVEGVAICSYGENREFKKSVKLEGIGSDSMISVLMFTFMVTGKYPHLVASVGGKSPATTQLSVSFDDVPIGQSAVKWIYITNISPVSNTVYDWLLIVDVVRCLHHLTSQV